MCNFFRATVAPCLEHNILHLVIDDDDDDGDDNDDDDSNGDDDIRNMTK